MVASGDELLRNSMSTKECMKMIADDPASGTTSEEDFDNMTSSPAAMVVRHRKGVSTNPLDEASQLRNHDQDSPQRPSPAPLKIQTTATAKPAPNGIIITSPNNPAIRDAVRHSLQHISHASSSNPPTTNTRATRRGSRPKFSDLVFTRKFSAFDRQNHDAANSPFHGFFTLFWMAVFFFVVKIGLDNWKSYGSPLGTNEIMRSMFRRDVLVLLVADGVMCGVTGVSWVLQRVVRRGWFDWDGVGWVVQNVSLLLVILLVLLLVLFFMEWG